MYYNHDILPFIRNFRMCGCYSNFHQRLYGMNQSGCRSARDYSFIIIRVFSMAIFFGRMCSNIKKKIKMCISISCFPKCQR